VSKRRKTAIAAHEFLHQHRKAVIDKVAQWTGAQRPLIKTLIDTIENGLANWTCAPTRRILRNISPK